MAWSSGSSVPPATISSASCGEKKRFSRPSRSTCATCSATRCSSGRFHSASSREMLRFPVAQPLLLEAGADARPQQHGVERLGKVVLRPQLDAAHDAVDLVEGRDHQDRGCRASRPLGAAAAPGARRLPASSRRAAQVRRLPLEQVERLPSAGGRSRDVHRAPASASSISRLAALSSTTRTTPASACGAAGAVPEPSVAAAATPASAGRWRSSWRSADTAAAMRARSAAARSSRLSGGPAPASVRFVGQVPTGVSSAASAARSTRRHPPHRARSLIRHQPLRSWTCADLPAEFGRVAIRHVLEQHLAVPDDVVERSPQLVPQMGQPARSMVTGQPPVPPALILDRSRANSTGLVSKSSQPAARALSRSRHRVSGQRDDGDLALSPVCLQPPRGFPAVDAGQAHVHENQLRRLRLASSMPSSPSTAITTSCPCRKPPRQHVAVHLVVLDQQDLVILSPLLAATEDATRVRTSASSSS